MNPGETVWLNVSRTRADYWNAALSLTLHRPTMMFYLFGAQFLVGQLMIAMSIPAIRRGEVDPLMMVAVAAIPFALTWGLAFIRTLVLARTEWRRRDALRSLSYIFTETSVAASTGDGEGRTGCACGAAKETPSLIVIHLKWRPLHVVPKRHVDASSLLRLKALLRKALNGRVDFIEDRNRWSAA